MDLPCSDPVAPVPGDTVAAVAALLPDARVELAETIRRTERSEVLRVRAAGYGTLIVKWYPNAASGGPGRAPRSPSRRPVPRYRAWSRPAR
jgi:hypothetical protein